MQKPKAVRINRTARNFQAAKILPGYTALTCRILLVRGSTASRPLRQPSAFALLSTASIRIRTRLAVSGFALQIGWRISMTSAV